MMFTWVDGHLIVWVILCPVAAFLIVTTLNAQIRRRTQARRSLESYWAGVEDHRPDQGELGIDLNVWKNQ